MVEIGQTLGVDDMTWAVIAAVLAAIIGAFMRGRSSGRDTVVAEQARQKEVTREEFQKIDDQRPDLDGALGRLRKRSGSDGQPPAK